MTPRRIDRGLSFSLVAAVMLAVLQSCAGGSDRAVRDGGSAGGVGGNTRAGGATTSNGSQLGGSTAGTTVAGSGSSTGGLSQAGTTVGGTTSEASSWGGTGGGGTSGGTGGSLEAKGGQGGSLAGGSTARTSASGGAPQPSSFKVLDQIPQFGIYATADPKNYTPPEGMLMWNFGTLIVKKLSDGERARILSKLAVRLTYHAQCDNYDRLGSLFFIRAPVGQKPSADAARVEIVRFITPFSNYTRGALATHVYPEVDISAFAGVFADTTQDVWLGLASGANPYDGDPCSKAQVTPEFRQVGYKISAELVSTGVPVSGRGVVLSAKNYQSETALPVRATLENPGDALSGRLTVVVSAHGSSAGGCEYMHTDDVVRVNDAQVGAFSTQIDCAAYAGASPDGNQGIFRNNGTTNPRNWCPGALVAPHTFPVTLKSGSNPVTLTVSPSQVPSGSYYLTTIIFTSP